LPRLGTRVRCTARSPGAAAAQSVTSLNCEKKPFRFTRIGVFGGARVPACTSIGPEFETQKR
jgi:hypothetical protein